MEWSSFCCYVGGIFLIFPKFGCDCYLCAFLSIFQKFWFNCYFGAFFLIFQNFWSVLLFLVMKNLSTLLLLDSFSNENGMHYLSTSLTSWAPYAYFSLNRIINEGRRYEATLYIIRHIWQWHTFQGEHLFCRYAALSKTTGHQPFLYGSGKKIG